MSTAAASRAPSRGWPSAPTGASSPAERAGRGRCCFGSPATPRRPRRSFAGGSPLDELELDRDPDAARVLSVLTESRLVTVDEDTVEVAHEALLREWPRLRGWLEADAEGRRLHQHLIHAAASGEAPGAIPPSSTAAPGSPRRSSGPRATTPS